MPAAPTAQATKATRAAAAAAPFPRSAADFAPDEYKLKCCICRKLFRGGGHNPGGFSVRYRNKRTGEMRTVAGEHSRIGYGRRGYIRYSRSRSGCVRKREGERYLGGVINKENTFTKRCLLTTPLCCAVRQTDH